MVANSENFKEVVLSKKAQVELQSSKSPTMKNFTNRNYEGEIMNTGDTVDIIQPDVDSVVVRLGNATDSAVEGVVPIANKQSFSVDKDGDFAFKISDRQKTMTKWNYKEGTTSIAMDKLGRKHALEVSDAILASSDVASVFGTPAVPYVVTKDNIVKVFLKMASTLYTNGATDDMMGGYTATKITSLFDSDGNLEGYNYEPISKTAVCQVPVEIYEMLIEKLGIDRNTVNADQTIVSAEIKRLIGMTIECDVTLNTARKAIDGNGVEVANAADGLLCMIAGTSNAVTFASKINKIETLRDQEAFVDIVRGKEYYGFKIYQPKALVKAFLVLGQEGDTETP